MKVVVVLAEGFEEIEAVVVVDVLRRAGVEVLVLGLAEGVVVGAHGIGVRCDGELGGVAGETVDAVVLPGGMPGTRNLMADPRVGELVRSVRARGRDVAAICAAPLVLKAAGVRGRMAAHPSVHAELGEAWVDGAARVVTREGVVTACGAGAAMEFALALVERWCGGEVAERLARAMLVRVDSSSTKT